MNMQHNIIEVTEERWMRSNRILMMILGQNAKGAVRSMISEDLTKKIQRTKNCGGANYFGMKYTTVLQKFLQYENQK